MTSRETATQLLNLDYLLTVFSPELLTRLDDEHLSWLPRLRDAPLQTVHGSICDALQAAEANECCLRRIAWLHCWLLPFQRLEGLRLHCLRDAPDSEKCLALLGQMAAELRIRGREVTLAWRLHESAIIGCLLTVVPEGLSLEHSAVFMVLWPEEPFLALQYQGADTEKRIRIALRATLGYDPRQFRRMRLKNIDEAFQAAKGILGEALAQNQDLSG